MIRAISIIIIVFLTHNVFSQNITNTLATNGLFYIKDASNTYFSLKQSNGFLGLGTTSPNDQLEITKNFRMPYTTSSSVGVIYKGSDRFIHNFAPPGSGACNTFFGINSGNFTMTASQSNYSSFNVAIGYLSLTGNSTGYHNTVIGSNAMQNNTSGYYNVAIGDSSIQSNTTGICNTAVGNNTLRSNNGNNNSAVGFNALYSNISGYGNTAMGDSSMYSNTIGYGNSAYGESSMLLNMSGTCNTAVGFQSLYNNGNFSHNLLMPASLYNVAVGYKSLFQNTYGFWNTAVGTYAGQNLTSGYDVTCIGYNSQPSSGSASYEVTLGDNNITTLRCNVTYITSLSDIRDKKNITDLSLGLDFLCKLKPRQFNWDKREWYNDSVSDGSKMDEKLSAGFIAQELDSVQLRNNAEWLGLVFKDNPDKLEATYGNLLPVVVKAVQELKHKNDESKKKNDELKQCVELMNALKEKLNKFDELIKEISSMKKDNTEENIKTVNNK